ncbi:hypothetical protein [Streptomyces sp. NPDC089915]|uniref:hypothetical protein n=1 Tax=Streptomyces sp. NPDC089915 TaxID=3155186 RepID=UPI00343A91CB
MIEIRGAGAVDGDALGEIHAAAWGAAYGPFFTPEFAAAATGVAAALMTGTLVRLRADGFLASGAPRRRDFRDGHPLEQVEHERDR